MPCHLALFPARWNHLAEKDSRQINILEQMHIAKVFNFGGICSSEIRQQHAAGEAI